MIPLGCGKSLKSQCCRSCKYVGFIDLSNLGFRRNNADSLQTCWRDHCSLFHSTCVMWGVLPEFGVPGSFGHHRGCPLSPVCDFPGKDLKTQLQCGEFSVWEPSELHLWFSQMTWFCWLHCSVPKMHWGPATTIRPWINEKLTDGWMDGSFELLAKDGYFQQEILYLLLACCISGTWTSG